MEYDMSENVVRTVSEFQDGRLAESTTAYDVLNRAVSATDVLGNTRTTVYDGLDRTVFTGGDAYPLMTGYDTAGRKTSSETTRDGGVTWDGTRWEFDPSSGLNTAKEYADGSRIAYAYTDNGKKTRTTWARGAWRENAYNARDLVGGTAYSDGTPSVAYAYADSGKVASAAFSDGTSYAYEYDERLLCTNETAAIGDDAYSIVRTHDVYRRDLETAVVVTNVRHAATTRLYDLENRICGYALTNAAGRGVSVAFAYDGSYLTNTVYTLPNGSSFAVRLTRESARRNLVTQRSSAFNGLPVYSYSTDYDLGGRPTNAVDSLSSVREWLYNRRSELVGSTIGTNVFGYAYDAIGNRQWASANATTNAYTANALNQYTSILCGSAPLREPTYDADGNLTNDGNFSYVYDAENRLVSVYPNTPSEDSLAAENRYDHKHRRVQKIVRRYDSEAWAVAETHTFVWDGNNIVLESVVLADSTTRTIEYFWGPDKSGTEQGAGGVGGLLAVNRDGVFYIPCHDHNGNIVCYVSETGSVVAEYVYDPYGSVIETYGTMAPSFNFGFSTKYQDREIGMVSYQRRFYSPILGRWLNRDPIEEEGGENLYEFCFSNPVAFYDSEGALVLIGPLLVFPQSPHWWDQLGSDTGPFNEEQWFENHYPYLLAEARQRFSNEINNGIDCSKNVFNGKSSRINIEPGVAGDWPWQGCFGGNDSMYGDEGQSSWEATAVLGKFSIDYVTPVGISYSCENGKRTFHWTTTMYVEDTLGLQGDEGWLGKYFGWAAKSRRVKRAQWTLSGSGVCK